MVMVGEAAGEVDVDADFGCVESVLGSAEDGGEHGVGYIAR